MENLATGRQREYLTGVHSIFVSSVCITPEMRGLGAEPYPELSPPECYQRREGEHITGGATAELDPSQALITCDDLI